MLGQRPGALPPSSRSPLAGGGLTRPGLDLSEKVPLAGHFRGRTPRYEAGTGDRVCAPANVAASFLTAACFALVSECR